MASLSVLTLRDPILPLVSTIDYEHLSTTKVENKWTTTTGGTETAKLFLPVLMDSSNKELFLYVIDQYADACAADRLNLHTGVLRYSKFRLVVNGDVRIAWQRLADRRTAGVTLDSFNEDLIALVELYFSPSSFEDQREYLRSATKPFAVTCEELHSRLRFINRLSRYLPGSGNDELFQNELAIKRAYFQMMPNPWRLKFVESGQTLEGNTYTVMSLVRFMAVQEVISKRAGNKRKGGPDRDHGRNGGRGGRGFGRGFGRGRGRGPSGNYQYQQGHSSQSSGEYATPRPNPYLTPRAPFSSGTSGYTPRYSQQPPSQGRGYGYGSAPPSGGRYQLQPRTQGRGGQYGRGRGRGGPPTVPTLHYDRYYHQDHYYQQEPSYQEHYYEEPGSYDNDYAGEYAPAEDHYYHQDQQDHQYHDHYHYGQESNQHHEYQEHQDGADETKQEDMHWLDDFGL